MQGVVQVWQSGYAHVPAFDDCATRVTPPENSRGPRSDTTFDLKHAHEGFEGLDQHGDTAAHQCASQDTREARVSDNSLKVQDTRSRPHTMADLVKRINDLEQAQPEMVVENMSLEELARTKRPTTGTPSTRCGAVTRAG